MASIASSRGSTFRYCEEADLHDCVHARAHARGASYLVSIDDVQLRLLGDELFLHLARQVLPYFFFAEGAIDKEHAARDQRLEHVVALHEDPLVTGDEVGFRNEITRTDASSRLAGRSTAFIRALPHSSLTLARVRHTLAIVTTKPQPQARTIIDHLPFGAAFIQAVLWDPTNNIGGSQVELTLAAGNTGTLTLSGTNAYILAKQNHYDSQWQHFSCLYLVQGVSRDCFPQGGAEGDDTPPALTVTRGPR